MKMRLNCAAGVARLFHPNASSEGELMWGESNKRQRTQGEMAETCDITLYIDVQAPRPENILLSHCVDCVDM